MADYPSDLNNVATLALNMGVNLSDIMINQLNNNMAQMALTYSIIITRVLSFKARPITLYYTQPHLDLLLMGSPHPSQGSIVTEVMQTSPTWALNPGLTRESPIS